MILVGGLLCAGFGSCREEEGGQLPEQAYEQGFTGSTRVAYNGTPSHADTYRIMAYAKTGTGLMQNRYQSGSYAYDLNGDYSAVFGTIGGIVPVKVDEVTYQTTLSDEKLVRNGESGLHLTAGEYYVSMIYPCVPCYQVASGLGFLAVFDRTDKVYASQPLDKNGDGIANDPFEINVTANDQLHDVTGVVMHPLMSAIKVYLYSKFYAKADVDHTDPKTVEFTVAEISLVNAGRNGWYNPMQEIVYPNYNYAIPTEYSKDVVTSSTTTNVDELEVMDSDDTFKNKDGETITAKYVVDNAPVFPSDYRGADMGGSPYVIPMTLQLKLEDSYGLFNKASIPISIEIKRNKVYKFYINVTSEQIKIDYTTVPGDWNYIDDHNYTDLGGDLGGTLAPIRIGWSGDWNNGGGGTSQEID